MHFNNICCLMRLRNYYMNYIGVLNSHDVRKVSANKITLVLFNDIITTVEGASE